MNELVSYFLSFLILSSEVRKKLNEFQFHDIDGHIGRLQEELRRQIYKRRAELERVAASICPERS